MVALAVAVAFVIAATTPLKSPTGAIAEITPEVWNVSGAASDATATRCSGTTCIVTIKNVGTKDSFAWNEKKNISFLLAELELPTTNGTSCEKIEPGEDCRLEVKYEGDRGVSGTDVLLSGPVVLQLVDGDVEGDRGILVVATEPESTE